MEDVNEGQMTKRTLWVHSEVGSIKWFPRSTAPHTSSQSDLFSPLLLNDCRNFTSHSVSCSGWCFLRRVPN